MNLAVRKMERKMLEKLEELLSYEANEEVFQANYIRKSECCSCKIIH